MSILAVQVWTYNTSEMSVVVQICSIDRMSKEDLDYLGKTCHNLTKLALVMPDADFTDAMASFKKLKVSETYADFG